MTPELEKEIYAFCDRNARTAQANARSMHELVAATLARSLIEFYKLLEDNLHGKETRQTAQVLDNVFSALTDQPVQSRSKGGRPRKDEVRQIEI